MYAKLRDRMNRMFWRMFDQGRRREAAELCRRWEKWWGSR